MSKRKCQECGTEFVAKKASAKFCCTKCRKDFNNRRAVRGAMLYDAFMSMRYDRKRAKQQGLDYTFLCRIGEMFNAMDEGRKTFRDVGEFMDEHRCEVNSRHGRV